MSNRVSFQSLDIFFLYEDIVETLKFHWRKNLCSNCDFYLKCLASALFHAFELNWKWLSFFSFFFFLFLFTSFDSRTILLGPEDSRGCCRPFFSRFFLFRYIRWCFEKHQFNCDLRNRIASWECVLLIQFLLNIWCEGIVFHSIVQIVWISLSLCHSARVHIPLITINLPNAWIEKKKYFQSRISFLSHKTETVKILQFLLRIQSYYPISNMMVFSSKSHLLLSYLVDGYIHE